MNTQLWGEFALLILLCSSTVLLALLLLNRLFPWIERYEEARPSPLPRLRPGQVRRIRPAADQTPTPSLEPQHGRAYWRGNRRLIVVLLLIWLGSAFGPPLVAPILNRVNILTGFPLGYYLSSQGALLVFGVLPFVYVWLAERRDRAFNVPPSDRTDQQRRKRLRGRYGFFTLGLVMVCGSLSVWEVRSPIATAPIGWGLILATFGTYALIGFRNRARSVDDYYVANRNVPALFNGMAISADWLSAASFISLAGTLWGLGYEGLAYIIGWTGGYVLLALLLVPYLRRLRHLTIPDFIGARYQGQAVRVTAALIAIIISFTYLTAQITGLGIIMSRFLGVEYLIGVVIGLGAVLLSSYLGGMQAITWVQVAQAIVLVLAYLVPVTLLALRLTGVPMPQLMYGEAMQQIAQLEATQGIERAYATPFNDWTLWNFLALALCLMVGTAGMPHILVRFYTTVGVPQARRSVAWALVIILVFYLTVPAYAAFARWEILAHVVGQPINDLPSWTTTWSGTGLLQVTDLNRDGVLQFSELRLDPDLVVLATPEIVGLPYTVAALVAVGGIGAALSTADGLLLVITSAFAHDIYFRSLNPRSSPRARLLTGRVLLLATAAVAALVATRRLGIIVQLVAWAFSLAASTFFPILVLGIFSKRVGSRGAVVGMIGGLATTVTYIALNKSDPALNILGIQNSAAGIFGIPVNFGLTLLVSYLSPPPDEQTTAYVDALRSP